MDLKLKGKTALVTGGSEGIGKGITLASKEGVDFAICARRMELNGISISPICPTYFVSMDDRIPIAYSLVAQGMIGMRLMSAIGPISRHP